MEVKTFETRDADTLRLENLPFETVPSKKLMQSWKNTAKL
jgi:hypothetical protein